MRVCLVSLHPRLLSGQISSLVGLARALRDGGHDVRVVTAFSEESVFDPARMTAAEAGAGFLPGKLLRLGRVARHLRTAAADADIVQVNLPAPSWALVGDAIQCMLRRPIVVGFEMHLPRLAEVGERWRAAPAYYLPQLAANNGAVARLARYGAMRYVVASHLQASELKSFGVPAERIRVIPNVIDRDHVHHGADAPVDGWPADGPVISYIGHFNHVKGVDVLARAFPGVLAEFPRARLVLAWSGLGAAGPVRRAIEESGVGERVSYVGRVPVAAALRRSDVFVLPYRMTAGQAAFPDLLLESLAVGVPLVTSDLPLIRELVEPGWEAELARPEDPVDLAAAILRVLRDRAYRERMVERQRHLIRTDYDPRQIVARYEEAYGSVVADRVRV